MNGRMENPEFRAGGYSLVTFRGLRHLSNGEARAKMPKEEKELLRKSGQGDAASFGEIVRRYQHIVYATALQIVKVLRDYTNDFAGAAGM